VRVPLSGAPVWLRDEAHALSVSASGIDVAWARTLAAVPDGFDGTVGVEATASGSAGGLTFDATVGGHIAVPELPEMPWALTAKGDQTRQTASLTVDAQPGRALVVQVEAEAPLRDALAGNPAFVPTDIPIDVRATASGVDIAPFGVFAPPAVQSPKGRLDLDAAVTGTIGAPDLRAVVGLRAGELRVSALNQRIHDIELRARVTNRVAAIEQLDFRSGDGRGTVTGEARIGETGTLDAAVGLRLVGFDIVPPGAPPLRVDSRVDVTATRGAAATPAATPAPLDVSVQLRETRVRVRGDPSRTPSPIPENPRIRYVDAAGQAEAAEAPTPEPGPPMPFAFVVDLSDPVRIQGPFLDMAWGGRVEAGQPVDGPLVVAGGVQAEPGSGFELLGNRFQVQRGEVAQPEAGGTPFIDLLAQTDAGEAVVTVTIRGPVDRPELTFGSEPAMPQYQVLTLLITGTTQASEEEEQSVQDQAAGLLAAFGNPELERQMQDRFGIDRVRLSFGETADQPILSVGKHLSRRLYVESQYHHNAPIDENTAELRTRYRLAPSWALETSYGDAAVGGVDVFWWTVFETDE
jgi:translocation and assembly module TamB